MVGIEKFKDWIKKYIHAVSATYLEKLLQFEDELGELEDSMQNERQRSENGANYEVPLGISEN